MVLLLLFLALAGFVGVLGQVPLVPSASRNPPPIDIPTPYHHASSVFASKGKGKSEKHEKKSKSKKKSEAPVDTDDLYYLFPDPVVIDVGGSHTDDDTAHDTTRFPFPSKIDIPLPPSHQVPQTPTARTTAAPTGWRLDYHHGYTAPSTKSKGEKKSKGSSKGVDYDHRDPDAGSIYLPPAPDCFMYGDVKRCNDDAQPTPSDGSPVYYPPSPPMSSPVSSTTDKGSKRKPDSDNDTDEKQDKLQKKNPEAKQELPPVTVSIPTPSYGVPSVRPVAERPVTASGTETPTGIPVASLIAYDPPNTVPTAVGPNPIPPNPIPPNNGGPNPNPNPNGMPIMGTRAPASRSSRSPVAGGSTVGPPAFAPVSPPTAATMLPSRVDSTGQPAGGSPISFAPASLGEGTGAPTLAPALDIFGTGLRAIQTDPLYLRVTGDFDPEQEEDVFFRNLEQLLGPYSRANIGSRLQEIRLTVDFITDPASAVAAMKLQVSQTSWSEIIVVYLISGDSYFSSALGTEFLERFFVAENKQRFISQLKNDGIDIVSLEVFDELPGDLVDDDVPGGDDDPDTGSEGGNPEITDPVQQKPRKNYTSAIVAAVLSGGIVLCALGAIIAANRRRRRQLIALGVYDAQFNANDDLGYDDIEEEYDIPIKGGGGRRSASVSRDSTVSTLPAGRRIKTESQQQPNVNEATIGPEEAENLEAAAALSDPDGDQSFCAMHNDYNELGASNQEVPQSPVWSVDNYSMSTPYSAEEEYVAARRRWHRLNDPDYIGLPDHHSVGGYEYSEYETNSRCDEGSIKAASIA